ncbi:uncharacterized protein BDV17DRAFT_255793 [Aspergillus undulatus]|uniref:uncharacterized protein n=1 Tax=Aspergillus undulatus TaxID=1810928 RepID=UPI003CCCCFFC
MYYLDFSTVISLAAILPRVSVAQMGAASSHPAAVLVPTRSCSSTVRLRKGPRAESVPWIQSRRWGSKVVLLSSAIRTLNRVRHAVPDSNHGLNCF